MKRRNFFKAFAALGATVVIAPSVLAKIADKNKYPIGQVTLMKEAQDVLNADFNAYLEELTRYHPGEKIMYCGDNFYNAMNKYAASARTADAQAVDFGIKVTNIRTRHGSYSVINSPYFKKAVGFIDPKDHSPLLDILMKSKRKPVKPKIEWTKRDIRPVWSNRGE